MAKTATEILEPPELDPVRVRLIGYLQAAQDPVTDWDELGVRRVQLEYSALALRELVSREFPILADATHLETAPDDEWITLDAKQRFNRDRLPAVLTQQTLRLTCDGTHGPYTITTGQIVVRSRVTGNLYRNISGGALATSGTLVVTVIADGPNDSATGANYADAADTLQELVNGPAGVTASNPAPAFSAVGSTPSPALGLGVLTVTGTPPLDPTAYDVQITKDGQATAALFRWRANGGAWSAVQTAAASFTIPSTSVVLHFANDGGGSSPSFRSGDLYSFTAPGSPITTAGTEAETSAALAARCFARWPSLEAGAVEDKRVARAKAASTAIKRVRVATDPTYPGRLLVTIAGAPGTGALSGGTVAAAQLALDQREDVGVISLVATASVLFVTATGVVYVAAAKLDDVQAAANVAWAAYVNGADIAGELERAKLVEVLMNAGAANVDVGTIQLNGVSADLFLASNQVASAVDLADVLSMVWVPL